MGGSSHSQHLTNLTHSFHSINVSSKKKMQCLLYHMSDKKLNHQNSISHGRNEPAKLTDIKLQKMHPSLVICDEKTEKGILLCDFPYTFPITFHTIPKSSSVGSIIRQNNLTITRTTNPHSFQFSS